MRFDNSFSVSPGYKQSLVIVDRFMPSGVSLASLCPELGWWIARVGMHEKCVFHENLDFAKILLKIDLLQFGDAFSEPGAFPTPAQPYK